MTWRNSIIHSDCLAAMEEMDNESVDLIYLDPPFNSKRTHQDTMGSFTDSFQLDKNDFELLKVTNQPLYYLLQLVSDNDKAYLLFLTKRLVEMHRIMKYTASIYLHCDCRMSHYLKLIMDAIFGVSNYINEIVWCYRTGGASKRFFSRKHDIIFMYSKSKKYNFSIPKVKSYLTGQLRHSKKKRVLQDKHGYYQNILLSKTKVKLYKDNKGYYTMAGCRDYWNIDAVGRTSKERTGYPTQKPLALLRRIIEASSNEGDIVLDPFCGSGTACVAAKLMARRWVGIDKSSDAVSLADERVSNLLF